jgi:hypothetical protein
MAVVALSACTPRALITTPYDLPLGGATHIVVHTSGGEIAIQPGPAGALHVDAERVALTESAARALHVTVALENGGEAARVDWTGLIDSQHVSVSFMVTVPPALSLELDSGGGEIRARAVTGGIVAHSGGGDLEMDDTSGPLDGRADGGDIKVRRYAGAVTLVSGGGSILFDGALTGKNLLRTTGGSIDAAIPAQSRLAVSAQTGGGALSNDFGLPIAEDGIVRRFQGTLGDGSGGSLQLTTGGGDVVLHGE